MWGIDTRFVCARRGELWWVTLYGDFELEAAKQAYRGILEACTDGGPCRALLDCRMMDGSPTTLERYEFGEFVARENAALQERGRATLLQVALLCEVPLLDERRFGQTVATNRGAYVKASSEVDEALRWLGFSPAGELVAAGAGSGEDLPVSS
ncbi:hypothetical protein [Longimicrobium sp.]|uniref:hypothetical protein n=1 Tax=Longimicrobium sp. TaxID=2029185 RepID=UPI002CB31997|nr:hypothetical protein [Longimicrobium sp.]HSU16238.1 hypothetical protein [Longimicrobium sp.]